MDFMYVFGKFFCLCVDGGFGFYLEEVGIRCKGDGVVDSVLGVVLVVVVIFVGMWGVLWLVRGGWGGEIEWLGELESGSVRGVDWLFFKFGDFFGRDVVFWESVGEYVGL